MFDEAIQLLLAVWIIASAAGPAVINSVELTQSGRAPGQTLTPALTPPRLTKDDFRTRDQHDDRDV